MLLRQIMPWTNDLSSFSQSLQPFTHKTRFLSLACTVLWRFTATPQPLNSKSRVLHTLGEVLHTQTSQNRKYFLRIPLGWINDQICLLQKKGFLYIGLLTNITVTKGGLIMICLNPRDLHVLLKKTNRTGLKVKQGLILISCWSALFPHDF